MTKEELIEDLTDTKEKIVPLREKVLKLHEFLDNIGLEIHANKYGITIKDVDEKNASCFVDGTVMNGDAYRNAMSLEYFSSSYDFDDYEEQMRFMIDDFDRD